MNKVAELEMKLKDEALKRNTAILKTKEETNLGGELTVFHGF